MLCLRPCAHPSVQFARPQRWKCAGPTTLSFRPLLLSVLPVLFPCCSQAAIAAEKRHVQELEAQLATARTATGEKAEQLEQVLTERAELQVCVVSLGAGVRWIDAERDVQCDRV